MNTTILSLGAKENPANAKPLGIAVIGCGYWGMNYVRIFNEMTDARVVAVCDQSSDRLKEVARRFPGLYLTTEVNDVISEPGVDAVVVCTEATTHYKVARDVLLSGKHVLVEKPLTTTSTDRKSTRLNSSHSQISYAVFCLKKKSNRIYLHIDQHIHQLHLRLHTNCLSFADIYKHIYNLTALVCDTSSIVTARVRFTQSLLC